MWVDPTPRGGSGILKFTVRAYRVSEAEWLCRTAAAALISILKRGAPGFADCYPMRTAARVAAWPVRSVRGRRELTIADIEQGRSFPDWVVSRAAPDALPGGDETVQPFSVPYGCLLPKRIDNLLLAGRCVAAEWEARARCLTIPFALASGQAAGTAAALAAQIGGETRNVDTETLQDRLLDQGVACPRPQYIMDGFSSAEPFSPPVWRDEEEIPVIPEDAGISLRPEYNNIACDDDRGEAQEELWQEELRESAPIAAELPAYDAYPGSMDSGFEIEEWSVPETDAGTANETLRFLPEEEQDAPTVPARAADEKKPQTPSYRSETPVPNEREQRVSTRQDRAEERPGRMFSYSRAIPDPAPQRARSAPDTSVQDPL